MVMLKKMTITQTSHKLMLDAATLHAVTKDVPSSKGRLYETRKFHVIAIDICYSNYSVGSYEQYLAYCEFVGDGGTSKLSFGIGGTASKGVVTIKMLIGEFILSIDVHAGDAIVLILLSFANMD